MLKFGAIKNLMKKYILLLFCAAFFTSCQKMQPSGNMGVIKKMDGVISYTDAEAAKPTYVEKVEVPQTTIEVSAEGQMKKDSTMTVAPAMGQK